MGRKSSCVRKEMRHSGSGILHPAYSHTQEVQALTCMIDIMGFNLVARSANSLQTDSSKPVELLRQCAPTVDLGKALLHSSSFGTAGSSANSKLNGRNDLVDAVLTAHNTHHALILRPDNFDLAIAAQFSSFVNKHAEKLRGRFKSNYISCMW